MKRTEEEKISISFETNRNRSNVSIWSNTVVKFLDTSWTLFSELKPLIPSPCMFITLWFQTTKHSNVSIFIPSWIETIPPSNKTLFCWCFNRRVTDEWCIAKVTKYIDTCINIDWMVCLCSHHLFSPHNSLI